MTAALASNEYQSIYMSPRNTGSSNTAKFLQRFIEKTTADLIKPAIWQRRIDLVLNTLDEVYQQCSVDDWDGYSASKISKSAFEEARKFLRTLPSWLPMPDIVPEPDGSIGFEWYKGKNWVFIASINGSNVISYAGILGKGNKPHGTRVFDESIHKVIIENIKQVVS